MKKVALTDYTELVKALRDCASGDGERCLKCTYHKASNMPCDNALMTDAAAAIEALDLLLDQNTQRCDALRKQLREAHESYERHLNELEAQLPKRGEWINSKERMRPDMCSVCGCVYEADRFMDKIAWNYCPNCGAKMEVQE